MAAGGKISVGFNQIWAKKVGKTRFISSLKKAHPKLDLGAEYDKMFPPRKKSKKK